MGSTSHVSSTPNVNSFSCLLEANLGSQPRGSKNLRVISEPAPSSSLAYPSLSRKMYCVALLQSLPRAEGTSMRSGCPHGKELCSPDFHAFLLLLFLIFIHVLTNQKANSDAVGLGWGLRSCISNTCCQCWWFMDYTLNSKIIWPGGGRNLTGLQ